MTTYDEQHDTQLAPPVADYDAECDTEFGPQFSRQAWSNEDPSTYRSYRPHRSWSGAWKYAALTLGITLVVVVIIGLTAAVVGYHHDPQASGWPQGYTNPPTATSTVPPPVTVTVPPSTVTVTPSPTYSPRYPTYSPPAPTYSSSPVPTYSYCGGLISQANTDYPVISSQARGFWLPQVSSKQPGLYAEGRTWTCDAIYGEHMRLRTSYNAKLMWTTDWPATFKRAGWWVTVAGTTYDTKAGAQSWCDLHGLDSDHCFPVLVE